MDYLLRAWRIFLIFVYLYCMWYDLSYVAFKFDKRLENMNLFMHGRCFTLTYWLGGFFIFHQFISLVIELNNDQIISAKNRDAIRRVRDHLYTQLVLPLSLFVPFTFWMVYFWDRELIYPKSIDEFSPSWLNHAMHSCVLGWGPLEIIISYKKNPPRDVALTTVTIFFILYLLPMHFSSWINGIWAYPLMEKLSTFERNIIFIGFYCTGVISYFLGEYINSKYWDHKTSKYGREIEIAGPVNENSIITKTE